jgi:hypothetical protein
MAWTEGWLEKHMLEYIQQNGDPGGSRGHSLSGVSPCLLPETFHNTEWEGMLCVNYTTHLALAGI